MVCCSDSEYEDEIMTREDDNVEEEITDEEVQEDLPCPSNADQGTECDDHKSAGSYLGKFLLSSESCCV